MKPRSDTSPPSWAERLLHWFVRKDLVEEVTGDLEERFYDALKTSSPFRAKMIYWYEIIHYFRPFALGKIVPEFLNPYTMYKSYFKTAFRNLQRNKLLASINIAGLAIGMAVFFIIALWIADEWFFDKQTANHDRIGRILQNVTNNGEVQTWDALPWPLAEDLRKNYGGDFEQVVLTTRPSDHLLTIGEKKLTKLGFFSEPGFEKLFSLNMITGSATSLNDPSSAILSASAAKAFFGNADPINQIMRLDETFTIKIAGVYKDFPENSSMAGTDVIAPWELARSDGWIKTMDEPWRPNAFSIYVSLAQKADFKSASLRIRDAKLKRVNEQLAKKKPALFLHPMNEWHLYSKFQNGVNLGGDIQYVWLFGIIGVFVLLMACINFMNLMTAKSEQRAKEVGIRKSIGSLRSQLVAQFFSEAVMVALFSFLLSVLLSKLWLPLFNHLANKHIEVPWNSPLLWLAGFAFSIITGMIAGSYPALFLSSIEPGKALKGTYKAGPSAGTPRKVLVVMQFAISVILIVGTVTVFEQIQYAGNRPIGYSRDALVSVPVITDKIHAHYEAFSNEIKRTGAVLSLAEAGAPPTGSSGSSSKIEWMGKDPNLSVDFQVFGSSPDYGKTINWKIKDGRDFSISIPSDTSALIINQAAATYMGLKAPVGEIIWWYDEEFHIVGVVEDIVFRSPYEPVRPSIHYMSHDKGNFVVMKINPEVNAVDAVAKIEKIFHDFSPDEPFAYQFADEEYDKKFGNEKRIGKLAAIFTMLAIFISCLGIFGLASFVAEQRTKEIGVRKVLGASVFDVWRLLSRDFVLLVVVACVVAIPVSWYGMSTWLRNYDYRTEFPWWIVGAASIATLVITLITVSYHTLHAAWMKPVKSLRSE